MPVIIQTLNNSHSQQAIDLILPIQQIEFNVPVTLEDQPDLEDIENYYSGDKGRFWGAFDEGNLVGTIALLQPGDGIGVIRKMFVAKEYRGADKGISGLLLSTLINYAREQKLTELYLGTVGLLKGAIRFYEKNGFHPIDINDLPAQFPRMTADHIFYHRDLKLDE